ncbi:acetyltransferase [Vibrio cholerae]|nr:acetyltransferase [Vibrio cholerae]EGR4422241.1 acetyltransferase [Vibrio cholerae]EGR4433273.1 acetyltransferase [Vibrio cholerae]
MVAVVVFKFSVMRCQPFRRALAIQRSICEIYR